MSPLLSNLKHRLSLYRDENGATVLEWAVLASSIIAVAVLTITDLGQTVAGLYQRAANIIGAYL